MKCEVCDGRGGWYDGIGPNAEPISCEICGGLGEITTYLCKQCGRPGWIKDNQTYCDTCGPGVELVAAPDEASVYGMDCRSGRCEW
jgi:DnaJ-class molecular chaperone